MRVIPHGRGIQKQRRTLAFVHLPPGEALRIEIRDGRGGKRTVIHVQYIGITQSTGPNSGVPQLAVQHAGIN